MCSSDLGESDDLDAHVEIDHHPADDGELLVVLLAEHRDVGSGGAEQLGDDGGDTAEVPGSLRALQHLADVSGNDMGVEPVGVHGRCIRRVHRVDAARSAGGEVVVNESYEETRSDFTGVVLKVRSANPDVVHIHGVINDFTAIVAQMRQLGLFLLLTLFLQLLHKTFYHQIQ
mgnify:CR=1 FL=1